MYDKYSVVVFKTLEDMLDTQNKDYLRKLSKWLKGYVPAEEVFQLDCYAKRKADIIATLANTLDSAYTLKRILDDLTPAEYALLQENVYLPKNEAAVSGQIFQAKYDYEYPQLEHGSPLLIMMSPSGSVPLKLRTRLKKELKPPRALVPHYLEGEPELDVAFKETELQLHACEAAAPHDISTLLQWVQQSNAKVSASTGKPTAQSVKSLNALLFADDYYISGDGDPVIGSIRSFAWVQMLLAAKWVQINGSQLKLTHKGQKALQISPQEGLKQLWQAWLSTTQIHELHRIDVIKGQKSRSRPVSAAAPARHKIAEALADLEPGKWIALGDFLDYLVASGKNYEIVREPYSLHLGNPEYDNLGEIRSWDYIEGRFARCVLLEYAATLGLIDVALVPPWEAEAGEGDWLWQEYDLDFFSRYDGLFALRLTPMGAWVLGVNESYVPTATGRASLQVMPNHELVVLRKSCPASVRLFLERIAEPKSEKVWRLSDKRLLKSLESGLSMSHVLDFLTQAHGALLPETVQHWLEEIAQRTSAIKSQGYGLLLACESPEIQNLIAHHSRLKKYCLPAGDTHLVIYAGQESVFRQALRKLGYVLPLNTTEL